MENKFEAVSKRLEELTPEMVEFQKMLTAIPALGPKNGGEGEWKKYVAIREWMAAHNLPLTCEIHAPAPECTGGVRPNAVTLIPGENTEKTVWIMAHMDVVPPGDRDLWENDPFTAVVKDGKIIGRGTEDNQQGLTAALHTARAFIETGIKPVCNYGVVLCADEETGSEFGLDYVLQQRSDLFDKNDIIIVPDAGNHDGSMIEVAEKRALWLKFTTLGKQVHASMPQDGNNACRAACQLALELDSLYDSFPARNEIFVPPYSTFEPTRKQENVPNVNTIPGEDIFYMDCRVLPQYEAGEVLEAVNQCCRNIEEKRKVTIKVEVVMHLSSAPPTPADAPVVGALQRAIKEVHGVEGRPMGIGGGTVAASFRRLGLPTAVWTTMDQMAHQPNEYSRINNMLKDARVFAHVALGVET